MADIKAFASLLEQTVSAPRLSGSKVQSLTALSQTLTLANQDTELVTTFFRVNAALPPASQGRISSLYVFDAIARAARKDADKEKERGKAKEGRGMTGLISKMEGVVDAWVGGMVEDGKGGVWTEGRDKVKKILDIWSKGATFPRPTLDRLQGKVSSAEAGPSRQASSSGSQQAGRSTTPTGSPPAPPFSPVLPPLALPNAGAKATPPAEIALPASNADPAANLPPEILKLLGIQAAAVNGSGTPPPPLSTPTPAASTSNAAAPTIDIASLLASVRPQALPHVQPAGGQAAPLPLPPQVASALPVNAASSPGQGFVLDPRQLAAIAGLATSQPPAGNASIPPQGVYPAPTPAPFNNTASGQGIYPPNQTFGPGPSQTQNGYPSYPPQDGSRPPFHMSGSGPGTGPAGYDDPRGPPRRGSDGRSPPYGHNGGGGGDSGAFDRGRYSPPRYDDRERDGRRRDDGRRFDDRGFTGSGAPPPGHRGWGGQGRDDGPDQWGDRRDQTSRPQMNSNGSGFNSGGRGRSRSPEYRDGPPRGRIHGDDREQGRDSGYPRREPGGGHRSRGSFDDRDRERYDDGPRPGVRKNYGGFKGQAGRFDPPPSSAGGMSSMPNQQHQHGAGAGANSGSGPGRAPLPPGRDLDGGRAPLPPGRDMDDVAGEGQQSKPAHAPAANEGEEDMALDNSDDEGPSKTPTTATTSAPATATVAAQVPPDSRSHLPDHMPSPSFSHSQANFPQNANAGFTPVQTLAQGSGPRLETFDITSFNPMMPDSWALLAVAYRNTTGREPGQMDLMGFLAGQGPVMPMFGQQGGGGR